MRVWVYCICLVFWCVCLVVASSLNIVHWLKQDKLPKKSFYYGVASSIIVSVGFIVLMVGIIYFCCTF